MELVSELELGELAAGGTRMLLSMLRKHQLHTAGGQALLAGATYIDLRCSALGAHF